MKNILLEYFRKIREIAIIAMFSDDYLMNRLVLKGGNLLDIVYGISGRTSMDLDFSMENDFNQDELGNIEARLDYVLSTTFSEKGFKVFDFNFTKKPKKVLDHATDFWGGYEINFKIIEHDKFEKLKDENTDSLRRNATLIGDVQKRTFTIEISSHEYCKPKQEKELNDYTIHVYTPPMIVFEKLRSICQQMPEYQEIIKTKHSTERARDFFDIYTVLKNKDFKFNLTTRENIELLKSIFKAKKVPFN